MMTEYPILMDDWGALDDIVRQNNYDRVVVLTDDNTDLYCLPLFKENVDFDFCQINIPAGETHKNLNTCKKVWRHLIEKGADRHSLLINLGGGVIGDLGGFVASTFMRGIDFVQLPTTLLSMVDASIGGKLGVDFEGLKNIIGLIKAPTAVMVFTDFLSTLPKAQLRSGFAEIIKHGLIFDKDVFERCEGVDIFDLTHWKEIIQSSIAIKKYVVTRDPYEKGYRKILNFGHTIGHAIETFHLLRGHPILHGDAVAMGMIVEGHLSSAMKTKLSIAELDRISGAILNVFGHHPGLLPYYEQIEDYLLKDKKNKGGELRFSLLRGIGLCDFDIPVSSSNIKEALDYYRSLRWVK